MSWSDSLQSTTNRISTPTQSRCSSECNSGRTVIGPAIEATHGRRWVPIMSGRPRLAMRALQLYAPKADKSGYEKSIRLAAAWLTELEPRTTTIGAGSCSGWHGRARAGTTCGKARRNCSTTQRSDGGWCDLASMDSTAYATGRALVALGTAGLPASDAAYERGVQFLLNNQQEDGSWYVKTRALAFQPYFDSGFPYGFDQWISAAGTSWATMALTPAARAPGATVAARAR